MSALLTTMAVLIWQVLLLMAGSLVCGLVGRRFVRASLGPGGGPIFLALGMGSISTFLLLLGMVGWLRVEVVAIAPLILVVADRKRTAEWIREGIRCIREHPRTTVSVVLLALPLLALASYPPTAFDAMTYHLPYARAFSTMGSVPFLEDLRFPIFPQLQELLFAGVLLLTNDLATQLVQLAALGGTAWLLVVWGRALDSPRVGLWAAAIWLGNPLVGWIGTRAYVDAGLSLQVTAALFAWERWRATSDRRWLWISAATVGFAAATKYLGLFFVGALAVATTAASRSGRDLLRWISIVVLTAGVWYGRIVYETGSPLFPFYGNWLGFSSWSPELVGRVTSTPLESGAAMSWMAQVEGWGQDIVFLLLTPWRAVFDRAMFDLQAPLSPWYLVALPLIILAWRSRWNRRWSLLVLVYGLFWLSTIRDLRFLLPILPLVSLLVSLSMNDALDWATSRWQWSFPQRHAVRWVVFSAVVLVGPGLFYVTFKVAERGPLPVADAERTEYLEKRLPGYRALRWCEESELESMAIRAPTIYGVHSETLRYYAPGRYLGEQMGPFRYAFLHQAARKGPRALFAYLRDLDVDYLLVPRRPPTLAKPDLSGSECFERVFEDASTLLFRLRESCSKDTV
ncbi:MAG: hypothetical protein K8J08_12585 [Thermoanaerobaculia bacterium]|nr:hypothetical protein [Thermoanaerobaculia bacterium]